MPDNRWQNAAAYDRYMGRWSRHLCFEFIAWLGIRPGVNWLEIGCGTGSLTKAVFDLMEPGSVTSCDCADDFVSYCSDHLSSYPNLRVVPGSLDTLPPREGGYDIVVSSLVLNFLSEPLEAVRQMSRVCAPNGCVAACVWDYADGMEFLRFFWKAAAALDPEAANLDEGVRFPICHPEALRRCFTDAGLTGINVTSLTIPTIFPTFEDYWAPFLESTGPAPAYVASLSEEARRRLADRLRMDLGRSTDGCIDLRARAWAVKGSRTDSPSR